MKPSRVRAIDWLRGLVMLLMTVDHAGHWLDAHHLFGDMATAPMTPLPPGEFLTRWITHLCAPTFVFLAGAALALSVTRRRALGDDERTIDRFIASRGLFIAALDPLWMSWVFAPGHVLLQVLYAIGFGLVAMVPLRRLPDGLVLATGLALVVGGEALTGLVLGVDGGTPGVAAALLLT